MSTVRTCLRMTDTLTVLSGHCIVAGGGGGSGESENNQQSTSTTSSCTETASMTTTTACDTACADATDTACATICDTVTVGGCTPTATAGVQVDEIIGESWDWINDSQDEQNTQAMSFASVINPYLSSADPILISGTTFTGSMSLTAAPSKTTTVTGISATSCGLQRYVEAIILPNDKSKGLMTNIFLA